MTHRTDTTHDVWLAAVMRPYFTRELTRFALSACAIDMFWTLYAHDVRAAANRMDQWTQPDDIHTPLPASLRARGWYAIPDAGTVHGEYRLPGSWGAVFTRRYTCISAVVAAIAANDLFVFARHDPQMRIVPFNASHPAAAVAGMHGRSDS